MSDIVTATPTMAQIVSTYNNRVQYAFSIGLTGFKPLNSRFKTIEAGLRRIEDLESSIRAREASERAVAKEVVLDEAIPTAPVEPMVAEATATEENDMAKKAKKAKAKTTRAPRAARNGGASIKAKTEKFNDLVPAAKKAGVPWARVHTSDFGSHEAADKMIKRLEAAIASAR